MNKHELELGAKVLKSLANPLRLAIMNRLADGDELSVTELYHELDCSQSRMSQQLGMLEERSLVQVRRDGTTKYYSLKNKDFVQLITCLRKHMLEYLSS